MGLYENVDEEIAGRTAVDTAVTHTAASESLSVSNTSRHVDIYGLLHSHSAYAAALGAGVLDDLALS